MLGKKFALAVAIALVFPAMIDHAVRTIAAPARYEENAGNDSNWKAKEEAFDRGLFYAAVPAGLIALVIGACLSQQAVGSGLMFGGVFSIGNGYYNYWDDLPYSLKFASLLFIFIVLLFTGCRKLEPPPAPLQG